MNTYNFLMFIYTYENMIKIFMILFYNLLLNKIIYLEILYTIKFIDYIFIILF